MEILKKKIFLKKKIEIFLKKKNVSNVCFFFAKKIKKYFYQKEL
jgi:hypothetical protein